ncbi:MAG TPA: iron ABC transporter permease, partial [Aliicoccus persicus]|nr:iron ABC transporter permease [Aliicoccus persicus]
MKFLERHTAGIVTFLLFLFIFLPLLAVIINAAIPGIFFGNFQNVQLGDYRILLDIFTRRLWTVSLQNSLMLGIGAGVLGTIIGGVLATIRAKYDFKLGKVLDISAWVLLIAPSFLIAQGWILFAGSNGLANSVFGLSFVNEFIF